MVWHTRRFVAGALEELGSRPYTILYVHTECSYWQNSPGVRWLCSTYRRLPQACRDDLQRCYVLHADWVLSLAAATVCPWLQGDFWDKVSYVQLLEFLPPALVSCCWARPGPPLEGREEWEGEVPCWAEAVCL